MNYVCNAYRTKQFNRMMYNKNLVNCTICDKFKNCDEIFYRFSITRTKITDKSRWCGKIFLFFLVSFTFLIVLRLHASMISQYVLWLLCMYPNKQLSYISEQKFSVETVQFNLGLQIAHLVSRISAQKCL